MRSPHRSRRSPNLFHRAVRELHLHRRRVEAARRRHVLDLEALRAAKALGAFEGERIDNDHVGLGLEGIDDCLVVTVAICLRLKAQLGVFEIAGVGHLDKAALPVVVTWVPELRRRRLVRVVSNPTDAIVDVSYPSASSFSVRLSTGFVAVVSTSKSHPAVALSLRNASEKFSVMTDTTISENTIRLNIAMV